MSIELYSEAGRRHERCNKIKPMNHSEREKMYASSDSSHRIKQHSGEKKFSPFNTISRESRTSYLLRVTKEPNTQTNYEIDYNVNMKRDRRSTIDQAAFQRIIGPVNKNDFSIEIKEKRDPRCVKAFASTERSRPLTVRETHQWRKKHEHLDFTKQVDPERLNATDFLKTMKSTNANDSFLMGTLRETTESNFNNYKRFSLKSKPQKAHKFDSDSGHEYLKKVENREIQPEYDIMSNQEEFFRMSMRSPKGQLRTNTFREQIKTRKDRADPHWIQTIQYERNYGSIDAKGNATIDFDQNLSRKINQVHSKYPIRQSMKPFIPMNRDK